MQKLPCSTLPSIIEQLTDQWRKRIDSGQLVLDYHKIKPNDHGDMMMFSVQFYQLNLFQPHKQKACLHFYLASYEHWQPLTRTAQHKKDLGQHPPPPPPPSMSATPLLGTKKRVVLQNQHFDTHKQFSLFWPEMVPPVYIATEDYLLLVGGWDKATNNR